MEMNPSVKKILKLMNHWNNNNASDEQVLDHLMSLSMLSLNEDEKIYMLNQLKDMSKYLDELSEIDTNNVEPLYCLTENFDTFREDIPGEVMNHDAAINAQQGNFKNDNYFTIIKNK